MCVCVTRGKRRRGVASNFIEPKQTAEFLFFGGGVCSTGEALTRGRHEQNQNRRTNTRLYIQDWAREIIKYITTE